MRRFRRPPTYSSRRLPTYKPRRPPPYSSSIISPERSSVQRKILSCRSWSAPARSSSKPAGHRSTVGTTRQICIVLPAAGLGLFPTCVRTRRLANTVKRSRTSCSSLRKTRLGNTTGKFSPPRLPRSRISGRLGSRSSLLKGNYLWRPRALGKFLVHGPTPCWVRSLSSFDIPLD